MRQGIREKTAYMGVLLSLALLLSYVESLIPLDFVVPGIKLGLANLAVVTVLYWYGWREAIVLNVMRVLLSGFLFGNLFMIMYSLAGAFCSFLMMCFVRKTGKFSVIGVSISGGIFHNVGQIGVAVCVTETAGAAFYLPALTAAGAVTGMLIGLVAGEVLKHTEGHIRAGK